MDEVEKMTKISELQPEIRDQLCKDVQACRDKEAQLKEMMKDAERIAWADVLIRREEKLREFDPGQLELFEAAYNLSTPRMSKYRWDQGITSDKDDDEEDADND